MNVKPSKNDVRSDFLVIGSGVAGLSFALEVADKGSVTIITKKQDSESSTNYAQGGIATVLDRSDSFASHRDDTLKAGCDLCHENVVEMVVQEGPDMIERLSKWGVQFTMRDDKRMALGKEGGHSHDRIVHAKDLTGREIERALLTQVKAHPDIKIFENTIAVDLITEHHLEKPFTDTEQTTCFGAYVLDEASNRVKRFTAYITLISTGGVGQIYQHTTNPSIASGDGIAMAYRAGAYVGNLEFMQFHPTSLHHLQSNSFLISEALRGYGAVLVNSRGQRFMDKVHPLKSLAPRDIVARAIDEEMKRSGKECVWLDVTGKDPDETRNRFPNINARLSELGIDLTRDHIPVVPAAHYMCGGIQTDIRGRTTIRHLYTCGEAAFTGLHGANRLASNSLLEALVFSNHAARDAREMLSSRKEHMLAIPCWDDSGTWDAEEWVLLSHDRDEIKRLMWDYVGIVRSNFRLQRARRRIQLILSEVEDFYRKTRVTPDLIQLRNMAQVASLIIKSAIFRKESRGLHYNTDYIERDDRRWRKDTIIGHNRIYRQGLHKSSKIMDVFNW